MAHPAPLAADTPADLEGLAALRHPGTLLSRERWLVAPYDLEMAGQVPPGHRAASQGGTGILNAAEQPFRLDYARHARVHVINGMGVALGDSIIGLSALAALRDAHPALRIVLYRPSRLSGHVEQLYRLADELVAGMRVLPAHLDALPADEARIDVGNQLYRPSFAALPMIDYFLDALGVDPATVPAPARRNRWLSRLALPELPAAWRGQRYALFCAEASTPLRSIPPSQCAAIVERIARRYGLPVLGFGPVEHVAYTDVRELSPDTAAYFAWIRHAAVLVSADTSAIHAADGFEVPTLAGFTSIAPELRVRDYPLCRPFVVTVPPALRDRHASDDPAEIAMVEAAWGLVDWDALAWPRARE
ncbi:glycosyltransferase family 9 protein [Burkholderia gladioli]|uniref:glycosyltransferase family 9 protein n=1 Tax=Burkholderia gladioli TaxID=28095 RepID=UPI0022D4235E|nr:ADP-heptose--LPS heptosyltransferase [Burkholderia gladioli]MDA0572759.1 ADP-heptose--LPS heptosyltransferase [Burkholderia gladioli]MDA0601111.1 ADP-heptose--LPS heptosyltransferase [Burkholderia gladioli]